MIAVVDYGASNLKSVLNAFKSIGVKVKIASKPEIIEKADAIILPGVGNFGDAMKSLAGSKKIILKKIEEGTPFLGLCLGIQLVMQESQEAKGVKGLGVIEGDCKKFSGKLKVPHMGWNTVKIKKKNPLFEGIEDDEFFYFVHSYYPNPGDKKTIAGATEYGVEFPSVIIKDNVYATQFHPEKSGNPGLKILKNFAKLV
ncbi:MAG: imidazole glycerol phosphate synthase subunit HisH [Candidatus Altiarchaeales archaeon]|nr:imidazole glycerol phosphate synthase subunit HisH [Candidatus Altiarchaeales archaeon]